MVRRLKYFLVIILYINSSNAQLLPIRTFTTQDGLINNDITAVIEDQRGLLWVGTPFGINWFDGQKFTEIPIKVKRGQLHVTGFLRDSHNNIWVLTFYNGIYKFDGKHFSNHLPNPKVLASNSNSVFGMHQYDETTFLVSTDQNIFWFDGHEFTLLDKNNSSLAGQIHSVSSIKDKWIFISTSRGLIIYKKNGNTWEPTGTVLKDKDINGIIIKNNEAWVITNKGLLHYTNYEDILKNNFTVLLENRSISAASFDRKGHLWICTDKLYRLHKEELVEYGPSQGVINLPGSIYHDEENTKWMATYSGLTRLKDENSRFYDLRTGPTHSMITGLQTTNEEELIFGTFDGLGIWKNDQVKAIRKFNNRSIGYVAWLLPHKQGVIAGTGLGIILYKDGQISLVDPVVTSEAFKANDGSIWLGTIHGDIYRMQDETIHPVPIDHILRDFVDGIVMSDEGDIFIGYRGYGIRKYKVQQTGLKLSAEYTMHTGFPDIGIRSASKDINGNLLFGTRTNGLYIFSPRDNKIWHYNTTNGLPTNWVKNIYTTNDGNTLLATNKGVYKFSGAYDNPTITKIIFQREELTDAANAIIGKDNKLLVGTDNGLVIHEIVTGDKAPPAIFLTEISVNGKKDTSLLAYFSSEKRNFKAKENVITFEFAAVDLSADQQIQYRYKLEGQDADWILAGERNYVSYNLPPGSYTFKAQARLGSGIWSNSMATVDFSIARPFWKSGFFIAALGLATVLLIFGLYRYRLNQALKVERLRSRISTDLHDDIGSTLSSISILSEMASHEKEWSQSREMMKEIKQSSVSLMEKMDDIVWSINPRHDSIGELMLRIKRFAARLFEARDIDYNIHIDDTIHKAKLDMESRQHIYLIMKEAINNLVKYSGCTKASIDVHYRQHLLQIEIQDNGKGFNTQSIQLGNGILNMQKRADAIKGAIRIESVKEKGTVVSLQTKIK